jgi:hypothetical protein
VDRLQRTMKTIKLIIKHGIKINRGQIPSENSHICTAVTNVRKAGVRTFEIFLQYGRSYNLESIM